MVADVTFPDWIITIAGTLIALSIVAVTKLLFELSKSTAVIATEVRAMREMHDVHAARLDRIEDRVTALAEQRP